MKKVSFFIIGAVIFIFGLFPKDISAQVVINEFVPDSGQEWIELYNASGSADYLKSYFIDDDTNFFSDSGSSTKKQLTNLNISNPTFPTIDTSSFLNNSGDWVVLFDQEGDLVDEYEFSSNPGKDLSIGRYPDRTGTFSILVYSTKADANSAPPTPVPSPSPTLTPTPTEVAKPTNTPTVKPTSTPTKKPSPTPVKTPASASVSSAIATTAASTSGILGVQIGTNDMSPPSIESPAESKSKTPLLPIILVISGVCFIAIPISSIIRNGKKDSMVS
jgi:hypothetical protein